MKQVGIPEDVVSGIGIGLETKAVDSDWAAIDLFYAATILDILLTERRVGEAFPAFRPLNSIIEVSLPQ